MSKKEFKEKYFTDNFYWVNKNNYKELQEIGIEFDCLNPNGKKEIIEWHKGFKNLGFRTYARNNFITFFQKEDFLVFGKTATDYNEMINEYKKLKNPKEWDYKEIKMNWTKNQAIKEAEFFLKDIKQIEERYGMKFNSDTGDIYISFINSDTNTWDSVDIGWDGDSTGLKVKEKVLDEDYFRNEALKKLTDYEKEILGL